MHARLTFQKHYHDFQQALLSSFLVNKDATIAGFSYHDRYHIASAVETELARLFTDQGVPASLKNNINVPTLNAGSFEMGSTTKANSTGNKIAGSIYKTFGK